MLNGFEMPTLRLSKEPQKFLFSSPCQPSWLPKILRIKFKYLTQNSLLIRTQKKWVNESYVIVFLKVKLFVNFYENL